MYSFLKDKEKFQSQPTTLLETLFYYSDRRSPIADCYE